MSQIEDLEAIDRFFRSANTSKPGVASIVMDWSRWFDGLSTISKYANSGTLDEARRRRAALNAALGTPENPLTSEARLTDAEKAELAAYPTVNVTGMTPEQANKAAWTAKSTGTSGTSNAIKLTSQKPTLRVGSKGEVVKEWQRIIGVTADGIFGQGTFAATKVWQQNHALKADGVVGPATWAASAGTTEKPGGILYDIKEALGPIGTFPISSSPTGGKTVIRSTEPAQNIPKAAEKKAVAIINDGGIVNPAKNPTVKIAGIISPYQLQGLPLWSKFFLGGSAVLALGYGIRHTLRSRSRY